MPSMTMTDKDIIEADHCVGANSVVPTHQPRLLHDDKREALNTGDSP